VELCVDRFREVLVGRSSTTRIHRFFDLAIATFVLLNFLSGCAGGSGSSQTVSHTYTISGTISPSSGGSGSTLTLSGPTMGSTTADGSGNYSFAGLANGTYVVTPSHSGYTFSPSLQTVTMNGTDATNVNFSAATQTSNSVDLSWIASVSVVSGYNVYRGTTNGGPYTKINSSLVTTLSYTDTAVASGSIYYYVCTSVDSEGLESIYSNQVTAQIP
jgi:Carboxypeptidase regulatory-like domain